MSLGKYIEDAREKLRVVEGEINAFDFQKNTQQEYEKINRNYQQLNRLCSTWDSLEKKRAELVENKEMLEVETDQEMQEMIQHDIKQLEEDIARLEQEVKILVLPPHPSEGRPAIVEIRPAAGGDEAGLFAGDLFRMYTKFAELKHWKMEILDITETELGGIKAVSFSLTGPDAFTLMALESGVHRVQRVPTTETQGRVHTSTVTVAVLAEPQDVDIKIDPSELRIDVFRASGAGGQCVNRTDSAVRITHLPTGIFVASQQERSQHRNRDICMRMLRAQLLEIKQQEEDKKNAAARRSQVGTGDRSERIRTYNFPENRISDHRFGLTRYDLSNVLEGNMEKFLQDIQAAYAEQRLAEELGE